MQSNWLRQSECDRHEPIVIQTLLSQLKQLQVVLLHFLVQSHMQ